MTFTGTLVYDPVHRVSKKQEAATRRTHAQTAMGHLARLVAHKNLQGRVFKSVRSYLETLVEDPHYWTRLGKDQATVSDVTALWKLLQELQELTQDPPLAEFLAQVEAKMTKTETKPWTSILKVDTSVTSKYLREIRGRGIKISAPAWGPHVTVVRGEQPSTDPSKHCMPWGYREGEAISFQITSEPRSNRNGHWWVDITSPELEEVRQALGLPIQPQIPFHLTIGKEQGKEQ